MTTSFGRRKQTIRGTPREISVQMAYKRGLPAAECFRGGRMTIGWPAAQTNRMGKPAWTWDFLRPLGMSLSWVIFLNVPEEIQRAYASEIAAWDVRQTVTLELWEGVSLTATPRYYPSAAFVIKGPDDSTARGAMLKRAREIAKAEADETARIYGVQA